MTICKLFSFLFNNVDYKMGSFRIGVCIAMIKELASMHNPWVSISDVKKKTTK